jgi:hypothetical protein
MRPSLLLLCFGAGPQASAQVARLYPVDEAARQAQAPTHEVATSDGDEYPGHGARYAASPKAVTSCSMRSPASSRARSRS